MGTALILIASILLISGIFAMFEASLMSARKAKLTALAEVKKGAKLALKFKEDSTNVLSTIQVGITLMAMAQGVIGEKVFAEPFAKVLIPLLNNNVLRVESDAIFTISQFSIILIVSYTSIVLSELIPKRLGVLFAEEIVCLLAPIILIFQKVFAPFVWILSKSTLIAFKVLKINGSHAGAVSEEEINAVLEEGQKAGVIEQSEQQMVKNLFKLDDRQLPSLMQPRSQIIYIDINESIEEQLKMLVVQDQIYVPLVDGDLSNILGMVNTKKVLASLLTFESKTQKALIEEERQSRMEDGESTVIENKEQMDLINTRLEQMNLKLFLEKPIFVPETLTGMELLEHLKTTGTEQVFVIDEYGEVQGLVSLAQLMEAITGEVRKESNEDAWVRRREDGSFIINALIPIVELKEKLNIKEELPEETSSRYHTLSGLLMLKLSKVPQEGDSIQVAGFNFEVIDKDGHKIDKVLATVISIDDGTSAFE